MGDLKSMEKTPLLLLTSVSIDYVWGKASVKWFPLSPKLLFLTQSHIIVKPLDYMLMCSYLVVKFPQDSSYLHLSTNLPAAHRSSSPCLSPFTRRLLRCRGLSVPHIIISETHTAHTLLHRWVAQPLSGWWIGNYLPYRIVSPSSTCILIIPPHSSVFHCCHFLRLLSPCGLGFNLSWGRLRRLFCKHTHTHRDLSV